MLLLSSLLHPVDESMATITTDTFLAVCLSSELEVDTKRGNPCDCGLLIQLPFVDNPCVFPFVSEINLLWKVFMQECYHAFIHSHEQSPENIH